MVQNHYSETDKVFFTMFYIFTKHLENKMKGGRRELFGARILKNSLKENH